MEPFFIGLEPEIAMEMADMARRLFALREERKQWLASVGHEGDDDQALLDAIRDGRVAEHPGYEIWLASQLSLQQQQTLRERLDWRCRHPKSGELTQESAHPLDAIALALNLPDSLHPDFMFLADGLGLRGKDGQEVMIRWLSSEHWSVEWRHDGELWRLDTAPVVHAGVTTPAHLHQPDGTVINDPFTADLGDHDSVTLLQRIIDELGRRFA